MGYVVGISENVGPAMTYKILTSDTRKIIYRSVLRPHTDEDPNLRLRLPDGEVDNDADVPEIVKMSTHRRSHVEFGQTEAEVTTNGGIDMKDEVVTDKEPFLKNYPIPIVNPEDLIGRTFLTEPNAKGEVQRARIVDMIKAHRHGLENQKEVIKFKVKVGQEGFEDVVTYNQVVDAITKDEQDATTWKFKRIVSHQGPLTQKHPDYNGSRFNVMIEWENGEVMTEPLSVIAEDDPVSCAVYARDNKLLHVPGWRQFEKLARRQKRLVRLANQEKLRSYRTSKKYKFGYEIPRSYQQAMDLDKINGNTKWKDAADTEMKVMSDYNVFTDLGHKRHVSAPRGSKYIRLIMQWDVKHDGRHKMRLCVDGSRTPVPLESVYQGMVSLRGVRMVMFLAELNGMECWSTDVTAAYLESVNLEKHHTIGGPEFGDLEGHVLVIYCLLYTSPSPRD